MSKNVFQEYEDAALAHFSLEDISHYGVCSSSAGEIETIIVTEAEYIYKKVRDVLSTSTSKTIGTWKKAFVLPKSPVSLDRIKSALKEHGIVVTNEWTDADLIVTHNDFYCSFKNGDSIQSTALMGKLWNYETFKDSTGSMIGADKYVKDTGNPVIFDDKCKQWFNIWNADTYDTVYDAWYVTGLATNLAHAIETQSLAVVDVEDIIHQSANKQILDDQLVKDLVKQVDSYNEEDNAIAGKILPTVDYNQKHHLLWQLAQEVNNKLYKFNRNKDVQYWKDQSRMDQFHGFTAEQMIQWLEAEDLLTKENFRYLEPIVRSEIEIDNRDLYVFKVQVKPEYRKFLKSNKKDEKRFGTTNEIKKDENGK